MKKYIIVITIILSLFLSSCAQIDYLSSGSVNGPTTSLEYTILAGEMVASTTGEIIKVMEAQTKLKNGEIDLNQVKILLNNTIPKINESINKLTLLSEPTGESNHKASIIMALTETKTKLSEFEELLSKDYTTEDIEESFKKISSLYTVVQGASL